MTKIKNKNETVVPYTTHEGNILLLFDESSQQLLGKVNDDDGSVNWK